MSKQVETKKTLMVLKADLQCCRCYKKVKKVLCKFPEIQDQVFKEKENLVLITVVCCCPEKLKQKIISKGGGTITCIEIKEPEKPQKPEPVKPQKPEPVKNPKEKVSKPDDQSKKPPPKPVPVPATVPACPIPIPCHCGHCRPLALPKVPVPAYPIPVPIPCHCGHCRPLALPKVPVPIYPSGFGACCEECSEGRGGGPCHYGHGRPGPLPCYGTPVYDSYGGGYRSCYARRSEYYCEESSPGCTIM
ncbi:protein PYRICULARIA ORYZAE RESISTANCE 21 isoform X2 [Fagus crenata]